jgi:hypothetical protein
MPEQVSTFISRLQAHLPELTRGEVWTMIILVAAVVAASLFLFLKPRTGEKPERGPLPPRPGESGPQSRGA